MLRGRLPHQKGAALAGAETASAEARASRAPIGRKCGVWIMTGNPLFGTPCPVCRLRDGSEAGALLVDDGKVGPIQ